MSVTILISQNSRSWSAPNPHALAATVKNSLATCNVMIATTCFAGSTTKGVLMHWRLLNPVQYPAQASERLSPYGLGWFRFLLLFAALPSRSMLVVVPGGVLLAHSNKLYTSCLWDLQPPPH